VSLYDYEAARLIEVDGHPFYALIMAAMRQADTGNLALLRGLPDRSVDMVYADPPFNTGRVWSGTAGSFSDVWKWRDAEAGG